MTGGIGSRFWLMSTPDYPKQFIDVMGVGCSLIQLTVDRLKPICTVENMWVVTNEKYISRKIQKRHPKANIVVTPSDALVINTTEYQRVLSKALSYTSDKEAIATISILYTAS